MDENRRHCAHCGSEIEQGQAFCTNCGQKVEPNREQQEQEVEPNGEQHVGPNGGEQQVVPNLEQ